MTFKVTKTFLNSLYSIIHAFGDTLQVRDFSLKYPDDNMIRTKKNYHSTDKLLISDAFSDLVQFSVL